MTSEQVSVVSAVAVAVPIVIGVYLIGRLRQGDLRLWRDGLVCAALAGFGLLLILTAGEPAISSLVLPALLAGLGVYALLTSREFFLRRTIGTLAVLSGVLGFILGLIRLSLA